MTDPAPELDPITLEILANALRSVTDESFVALMRSAYSTNIKERHDHSTTIMDRQGAAHRAGASVAADPPCLDVGADGSPAREIPDRGDRTRATCSSPTTRSSPAARICPTSTSRCRCSWAASSSAFVVQHRASRRHRRHGAGQHGGRHVRDLSGGAAHPGPEAVPPRRAAAGPARTSAPERARARGAARRLLRPDRGRQTWRPPSRGCDPDLWQRDSACRPSRI